MTFSDRSIIDLVRNNFVAAWEPAAPASVATFDLGDGRSVSGTVGGEIAIYFCRPDGSVFDILPALQSPAATRKAIERALRFYRETGATRSAVHAFHWDRTIDGQGIPLTFEIPGHEAELAARVERTDTGTAVMSEMLLSKTAMIRAPEAIIVVEPGGLDLYRLQLDQRFAKLERLLTPDEWKPIVFEEILGQKLEAREYNLDSSTVVPMSIQP